jgi:hypothetical protein
VATRLAGVEDGSDGVGEEGSHNCRGYLEHFCLVVAARYEDELHEAKEAAQDKGLLQRWLLPLFSVSIRDFLCKLSLWKGESRR